MATPTQFQKKYERSKSLADMYVYYERLKQDGYTQLYYTIKKNLGIQRGSLKELQKTSENLRRMGAMEKAKETAFVQKVFHKPISVDFDDRKSVKEFIDVLNEAMNFKDLYKRNLQLLLKTDKQKTTISYYPSYFIQAWNAYSDTLWEKVASEFERTGRSLDIIFEEQLKKDMNFLVVDSIERMFRAQPELGQEAQQYADAYKALLGSIGTIDTPGSLAQQFKNIYKLDALGDSLKKALKAEKEKISLESYKKAGKSKKFKDSLKVQQGQRGGIALEAIENLCVQVISQMKINGKVETIRGGGYGIKSDNMYLYGIDTGPIGNVLERIKDTDREHNIEKAEEINKYLQTLDDGFIVYSNAKNYTMSTKFFKEAGFSAGAEISAQTYLEVMKKVNKNVRTFIGVMINSMKDAVGENMDLYDTVCQNLAQDIAMMLFDDYETVGKDLRKTGVKSIHIMDLNGVFLPLSFFLDLMARAIDEIGRTPEGLVKVEYRTPKKIKYDTNEEIRQARARGEAPWASQKEEALRDTKISYHFLKDFRDILFQYMK